MARIAGINLASKKQLWIALTAIAGIGQSLSRKICATVGIDPATKVDTLTEADEARIRAEVAKVPTEGDLRRLVTQNVKLLQEIGSYRGDRHKKHLPCRGQKTKTNARTRRGKKVTQGSGRRKETKK